MSGRCQQVLHPPRFILIANAGTPRCSHFCSEFKGYLRTGQAEPELHVVPWAEVIARGGDLADLALFDEPAIVRIESPGKDYQVTQLLLESGAHGNPSESRVNWREVDLPFGCLVRPGLYHLGFRRVLEGLHHFLATRPHLQTTAAPLDIAVMFDKAATAARLLAAAVPTPEFIPGPPDSEDVLSVVRQLPWSTTYAKLNTGSSASGIVALSQLTGCASKGISSLVEHRGCFYNTRSLRRMRGDELTTVLRFLAHEGLFLQRGIAMAQLEGQNFDVRVLCVARKPVATIFRLSSSPMTNLHLGGRRGDPARCRAAIPTRHWLDAMDHCVEAASCFDSLVVGVDLLFERGLRQHHILEVNAFGDFFPGWVDSRGRSIYELELDALAARNS